MGDGIFIFLMEFYSKFLVNYFIHFLYVLNILEAGIVLDCRKWSNIASVAFALVSLRKFFYALYTMPNPKTIAEFSFNFLALAFIIALINYGKVQSLGKIQQELLYQELLKAYDKLKEYSQIREEAVVLYRIFQESLTNAIRHGRYSKIEIQCKIDHGNLYFHIRDNGIGSTHKIGGGFKL